MSSAFEESATPDHAREPDAETGLAPDLGPDSAPETKGAPETGRDAEVAEAELVDVEGEVAGDPDASGGGSDTATPSAMGDLSGLEILLSDDFARISAERDQFLDSLQRLQADFDNFRKRTDRHQAELRDRANEALLARLLPVLDALDLALAHLGLGEAPPTDEASASLLQVNTMLRDTLEREGLERIDSVGVPFDPTVHDATAIDDGGSAGARTDDGPDTGDGEAPTGPTVTEVWRAGYRLKDRVIRPAMVRVRG